MQDRSQPLPYSRVECNQQFNGNITIAAKESVVSINNTVKGDMTVIAGVNTEKEAEEISALMSSTATLIKQLFFHRYPPSTRLTLQVGGNGYCEAYLPDADGIARDADGNSAGKSAAPPVPGHVSGIFKWSTTQNEVFRNALDDPQANIRLVSVMRR